VGCDKGSPRRLMSRGVCCGEEPGELRRMRIGHSGRSLARTSGPTYALMKQTATRTPSCYGCTSRTWSSAFVGTNTRPVAGCTTTALGVGPTVNVPATLNLLASMNETVASPLFPT